MSQRDEFNTLAIYAFRYALGRRTYAVSEMCDLLIKNKDKLSEFTKQLMIKEIRQAKETQNIGMDCDCESWFNLICELYQPGIKHD